MSDNNLKKNINNIKKSINSTAKNISQVSKNMGYTVDVATKQTIKKVKSNIKEKSNSKINLDNELMETITLYNKEYNNLSDLGISLFYQRKKTIDLIENIEVLINSIANHPKEFDKDINDIKIIKDNFKQACDFSKEELEQAQKSAISAGVGVTSGLAIVSLAPSAAMWVATTFGTASTGTAISALSGAAANSAALAWLGGGSLATGGSGVAGGSALLAMAGPIGWGVAGATLLTSIVIFANNKKKINKEKAEEIKQIKNNISNIKKLALKVKVLYEETITLYSNLTLNYRKGLYVFNKDYNTLFEENKLLLASIVNETKAIAKLIEEGIDENG